MHLDYPSIEFHSTTKQKDKHYMIIALPFTAVQRIHNHIISRGAKKTPVLDNASGIWDGKNPWFIFLTFENKSFSPMTVSVQYLGHQIPRWSHTPFIPNLAVHSNTPLGCRALQQLPDFENFFNTLLVRGDLLNYCPQWPGLHSSPEGSGIGDCSLSLFTQHRFSQEGCPAETGQLHPQMLLQERA